MRIFELKLTPEEAARKYSDLEYQRINELLRSGDKKILNDPIVIGLDELFKRSKTQEPMILYRGLGSVDKIPDGIDPAYVSTSSSEYFAYRHAKEYGGKYVMKIFVPAETAILDMSKYSVYPNENEFLINRNSHFKIISIDHYHGKIVAELI